RSLAPGQERYGGDIDPSESRLLSPLRAQWNDLSAHRPASAYRETCSPDAGIQPANGNEMFILQAAAI
ncbi:hypothetical protein MKK70_08085, partial [Methylobacterium sp. E-041]|uniref:hypothetical protein n=1 Tax=Methylobacterium sp. E-041 TaxID=2836573 RepID=UPI001FB8CA62